MPVFIECSDLNGVRRVQDIKYMKQLRFMSRLIDGWPNNGDSSKHYLVWKSCRLAVLIFCLISALVYLRNKTGIASTFDLGHQYITIIMLSVSIIRGSFVLTKKYNEIFIYFLKEIHLFNHRQMSDSAYQIHIVIHKLCQNYTSCICIIAFGATFLFNLLPVVKNYRGGLYSSSKLENSTFETSLSFALFIDYETNLLNYIAIAIFNCYISGSGLLYFVIIDMIISIMVFHLWGYIKILRKDLVNFPKPRNFNNHTYFKYSAEESKEVLKLLQNHIKHHNLIISFLSRLSDTFGGILLVHYVFFQVTGCLMLYMCSPMDSPSLTRYGPLTIYNFQQLIQSSVIFELLNVSNDALTDAIYNLPWECMDIKLQKIVSIMLMLSQRSMKLRAMNMITVGVQTMMTILKTSFSYFLMIKTFAQD